MSPFNPQFAERMAGCNPSVIREILKVVALPEVISFAGGMPAPELFPFEAFEAAAARALGSRENALQSLQYGPSEGYGPLRRLLAAELAGEGITATEGQILITTGSQQALDMLAKLFLDPGDEVVVGDPTFLGALQSFNSYQANYVTVPVDEEGMRADALDSVLSNMRPKFIYAIPSFQNPTGVSMTEGRKQAVYDVARRHGVPILEDDPYGDLYYGGRRPTTIKSLDSGDGVILLRTFSKILAPGLRLGYVVMDESYMAKILPLKQSADLHSSSFNQVMVHEFLSAGVLPGHLDRLRSVYAARRDLMLELMARHFPEGYTWTRPEGGMFTWVTMPEGMQATKVLEEAVAQKVAFIPGAPFYALGGGENTFRLNFSNASEENIRLGIERLGAVLKKAAALV